MNIVSKIFESADKSATALIAEEEVVTFGELERLVDEAAGPIAELVCSRVALDCPNGIAHVILALAIVKAGKILVPVASELVERERQQVMHETGVGAIVQASGKIKMIDIPDRLGFNEKALKNLNPAFIRFSSGTAGKSKGIVLSHESLLERISAANEGLQISPSDRILWILPMAHHFAVSIILYLWRGATTIIAKSHLAGDLLTVARKHRATILYGAPFHHAQLAAETSGRDWPSLRLAVSTAAALSPAVASAFLNRYGTPLSQGLGVIEVGLPFLNLADAADKPTAIGRPLPSYKAEIRAGQLFLQGPGMLDAYLSPWRVRREILKAGWFSTGDAARVDEDGVFFLEGRIHSVINVAGMKCFPEEVEAVLNSHPGVEICRVSGRPHAKMGFVPIAEIIAKDAAQPPSIAELIAFCRPALARYKMPVEFHFVATLPRTASGKIKRNVA